MANESDYGDILQQIEAGKAMLFLGAGSTRCCRRPDGIRGVTGDELATELLTKLNNGKDPGFGKVTLMQASEFYASMHPGARGALDGLIQDRLSDLRPTVGHFIAASFPWQAVVTTNYNRVAEDAWGEAHAGSYAANDIIAIKTDEDVIRHQGDTKRTRLFKPHGCITIQHQKEHRMVLTSNDYFASETIRKKIYDSIRSLAQDCSTVFAGYSLADYTFKNIFYTLYEKMGQWTSRSYTVAPLPNPIYEKWLSRSMDDNFKTTVINESFDSFMIRLLLARGYAQKNLRRKTLSLWQEFEDDNPASVGKILKKDIQALPYR